MKKLNLVTVLSLTAGLTFTWNAAAADEVSLPGSLLESEPGVLLIPTEGAYGIVENLKGFDTKIGYGMTEYNGQSLGGTYDLYNAKGAWHIENTGSEVDNTRSTMFQSVFDDSVLSIAVERNLTANGFTIGTYTLDDENNPIRHTLGTVTDSGEVGKNGVEKITINPVSDKINTDSNGGVYSEAFKAKEFVGLWIQESGSDVIYYSNNPLTQGLNDSSLLAHNPDQPEAEYLYTTGYLDQVNPPGYAYVWFDDSMPDAINDQVFGWPDQERAFVEIHLTGAAPKFASQIGGPLPGVWATIALAGAAGTYLRRRKNK